MNSPDITIEDVNLQIDKSRMYIEGKVQVIITLKNHSKSLTYYVLKHPRDIDYDKGSHTLSIDMYKAGSSFFEPELIAILPDTTLEWQYLIPMWMKKITRTPGSREIVEVLDISKVQKVVCTVAETVAASFERRAL